MTASQPNLVELAKQGDARAIAALMNTALQPEGIKIRAGFASDCLMVLAESETAPEKAGLVDFIHHVLVDLSPAKAKKVVVQGRVIGQPTPVWHEIFDLAPIAPVAPVEPAQPEEVVPPPVAVPPANEPGVNEQIGNNENESEKNESEVSVAPLPAHPHTTKVVKFQRKQKPLLVAGASLAGLALCLFIGKQALEQTTSVSNTLPAPTQQTLTPDAIAAPPAPVPDTTIPKTAATEAASPTSQSATAPQKPQETTIAAVLEPSIASDKSVEAVSQSGKVSPAVSYQAIAKTATPALALRSSQMPAARKTASKVVCNSSTALSKTVFQKCLSKGMTSAQADQVIGLNGTKLSSVGAIATYQWQNNNHKVIATFHHDRLISKSQIGLK
jgi:hypothetical protein